MEVRGARARANRAVAAVQSATAPVPSPSPLLTVSVTTGAGARRSVVMRFSSFAAMCEAQQRPDEHAALRTELAGKLPRPAPRHDVTAIGTAALEHVLRFVGPVSRDAAGLGQTCRAARRALLRVMDLDAVELTPAMVAPAALAQERVRESLGDFVAARCGLVQTLVLRRDGLDAVRREGGDGAAIAPLTLPATWALRLVARLPCLTVLDLRHVRFTEERNSQALHFFLSDLYLAAAGTLCTVKMDAEAMRFWAPGWWRRHVNLTSLVVGSRYRVAESAASASVGTAAALELPADWYTLMREEGRRWRLKLWVPLHATSLRQILTPPAGTVYGGVAELLLCMHRNERTCEWGDSGAAGAGAAQSGAALDTSPEPRVTAASRKAGAAAGADAGDSSVFPALTAVTVVDVQERAEVAAEVYTAVLAMAPSLVHFNVCDSITTGAPAEPLKKRHAKA